MQSVFLRKSPLMTHFLHIFILRFVCFFFASFFLQMDTASDGVEIAKCDNQSTAENSTNSRQSSTDGNVNSTSEIVDNNESNGKVRANTQNQDTVSGSGSSSHANTSEAIVEPSQESGKSTVSTGTAVMATATSGQMAQDEYAQYITYNDTGVAIYTDPSTNCRYEFDKESNQWAPIKTESTANQDGATASDENVYENEHYRWCHTTSQWVLKEPDTATAAASTSLTTSAASATENEFYKWDAEKEEWTPKTSNQDFVSECKDGVHTYTDQDGVVFFWDTEKNAWFPKIDDDFMAVYQMNYGFVDNTSGPVKQPTDDIPTADASNANTNEDDTPVVAGGKRKSEAPSNYKLIMVVVR